MNIELKDLLSAPSSANTKTTLITTANESSQEISPSKFTRIFNCLQFQLFIKSNSADTSMLNQNMTRALSDQLSPTQGKATHKKSLSQNPLREDSKHDDNNKEIV